MGKNGLNDFPSSASLRELEEKLTCQKCKKIFEQPTSLTCGHVFCKECVPKYMVSICPVCKARFLSRNLEPAVQIEEMLKRYHEMKTSIRVKNSDNSSSVGLFAAKSSPIPTPQSIQSVNRMSINSSDVVLPKLTREEPLQDSLALALTSSKSSSRGGPSQVHVSPVENEFQLSPSNPKMILSSASGIKRTNPSHTNDSCLLVGSQNNPSASSREITGRKLLSGSSDKRIKLTSSRVPVGLYEDECIFCHSFRRNLEGFGQLFCIQRGKIVAEPNEAASKAKVYYAHKNCIDWSPQLFYDGDQIKNLNKEIQRSARLLCAKCGLSGATLGCFCEHCPKSYHPPCAYQVYKCRWDTVNYSMLCPDHVSERLPGDSSPVPSDSAANGNGRTSSEEMDHAS